MTPIWARILLLAIKVNILLLKPDTWSHLPLFRARSSKRIISIARRFQIIAEAVSTQEVKNAQASIVIA